MNYFGTPPLSYGKPLVAQENLNDVLDKTQARSNLGAASSDDVLKAANPIGTIIAFYGTTAPYGYLPCSGQTVSKAAFPDLVNFLNPTGTSATLPDLRGEFLRGWDNGRGVDDGRVLGSSQAGALQSHTHSGSSADAGSHAHTGTAQAGGLHNHSATAGAAGEHTHALPTGSGGSEHLAYELTDTAPGNDNSAGATSGQSGTHTHSISVGSGGAHTHDLAINAGGTHSHAITINATGSGETRPRNVAVLYCIKAYSTVVSPALLNMAALASQVDLKVDLTAFTGTNQQLSSSGYQKLPGGLIIQWGYGSTVTGKDDPITFPMTFPTICRSLQITEASTTGWGDVSEPTVYGPSSVDTSGFTVRGARLKTDGTSLYQGGLSYTWTAIGH